MGGEENDVGMLFCPQDGTKLRKQPLAAVVTMARFLGCLPSSKGLAINMSSMVQNQKTFYFRRSSETDVPDALCMGGAWMENSGSNCSNKQNKMNN